YQKRKDKICPFSSLAFFQPTTVDKEPFSKRAKRPQHHKKASYQVFKNLDRMPFIIEKLLDLSLKLSFCLASRLINNYLRRPGLSL
ncbi:hypothetical protein OK755_09255, partial [Streptococcus pneumoniae]|nr:hypothetical protein [Streptococcus pneumoniae]